MSPVVDNSKKNYQFYAADANKGAIYNRNYTGAFSVHLIKSIPNYGDSLISINHHENKGLGKTLCGHGRRTF